MSRPPNHATAAEERAEVLDWFWREVGFLKPWKCWQDALIVAELSAAATGYTGVGCDLPGFSTLELQQWAVRMVGIGRDQWPPEWSHQYGDDQLAELAAVDGTSWPLLELANETTAGPTGGE